MAEIKWSDEAQAVCDTFLAVFPGAGKEANRIKIAKGVEFQLLKKNLDEATKDIVLEAIENAFPQSFAPITMRLRDPKALMELAASQKKVNLKNPLIRVRRWDLPRFRFDRPVKKVLALLASPRKGGNTDCIMDAMLDGVRQEGGSVEKFSFSDLAIAPCNGCLACEAKELENYCAILDDMTDLYEKFLECDGFVMGFPVYTARECSQAAVFFDRLKALGTKGQYNKLGRIRKGGLVVTWGWPSDDSYNYVAENAAFILKMFGVETTEVVTGCGFWEAYYKKSTAKMDKKGMAAAKQAGRALVTG
jgi:multimeric flavodoxin WrbA